MAFADFLKFAGRFTLPGIWINNFKWLSNKLFKTDYSNSYEDFAAAVSNPSEFFQNVSQGLGSKYFETGPSPKEEEAREYTAQREDTAYQRATADMQNAGLNPALMYGGSSSPSASSQPQMNSGSLSDLLQIAMLPLQIQATKANIDNVKSDSDLKEAQAKNISQSTEFAAQLQPLLVEAKDEANKLTRAERNKINKEFDLIAAEIEKKAAETNSEIEKASMYLSQSVLNRAEAEQIVELMPYREALLQAQSDESRAQAALLALQAMYQKRLLNSDYLDNFFREMAANAASAESRQAIQELQTRIRTGRLIDVSEDASLIAKIGAGIVNYPVAVVANVLDNASGVLAAAIAGGSAVKVAGLKNAGRSSTGSSLWLPSGTKEFGQSYGIR